MGFMVEIVKARFTMTTNENYTSKNSQTSIGTDGFDTTDRLSSLMAFCDDEKAKTYAGGGAR